MGGMAVRDQAQRGRWEAVVMVRDNENVGNPSGVGPHEVEYSMEKETGPEGGNHGRRTRCRN